MFILKLFSSTFPTIIFNKMPMTFKVLYMSDFYFAEGIEKENIQNMTGLYWMIGLIGSCIIVTLSYVSWKKYIGEKKKSRSKHKSKQ